MNDALLKLSQQFSSLTHSPADIRLLETADKIREGIDLQLQVLPEQLTAAAEIFKVEKFTLECISGIDWHPEPFMDVVYDLFRTHDSLRAIIRVRLQRDSLIIPTVTPLFAIAQWNERETHEMFGIKFSGHPDLKPLLLPEDATFHPLRKDYQP